MRVFAIAAFWLLCGVGAAGMQNAYWQRDGYSCGPGARDDLAFSVGWGLFGGPFAAGIAFFTTGFAQYGWTLSAETGSCSDGLGPKWAGEPGVYITGPVSGVPGFGTSMSTRFAAP